MYFYKICIILVLVNSIKCKIYFPPKFIKQVEDMISKTYGERELLLFRQMLKDSESGTSNWSTTDEDKLSSDISKLFGTKSSNLYKKAIKNPDNKLTEYEQLIVLSSIALFKQEFNKLKALLDTHVIPHYDRFLQINANSSVISIRAAGLQHRSILNICSTVRGGADFAYDTFSTVVHVLGSVMSVLCGCLFVGPIHVCLLKNFPYTCKLPFPVFNSLFIANSSIWEVTKMTSLICRVYGDPGMSSTLMRYDR